MQPIAIPAHNGDIHCEQFGEITSTIIIWVFGAGGGFGGPARGVYSRLGERFAAEGTGSVCVDYRQPGQLQPCLEDIDIAMQYFGRLGAQSFVLVGHSFGGAVVIQSALSHAEVTAVAALSSQSYGTRGVERLSPRPLLLIHGQDDEILPPRCSLDIHHRAKDPRQLILYPGCKHGLDQCIEELDRDLFAWLSKQTTQSAQSEQL